MKNLVAASFDSPTDDYCVDIFERGDGTFGLEEYRRDLEDLKGWFSLHRHSHQVFTAYEDALDHAKAVIVWMIADTR
jgi:hypothetical protein